MSDIDLDGFAGPGGWDEAARALGLRLVGIEIDAAACATRAAAGHLTIRADVSQFPVERLAGRVRGSCWSPPCIVFSNAGQRAGIVVTAILADGIRDQFAGRPTRAKRRREMVTALRLAGWLAGKPAIHISAYAWQRDYQQAWKRKLLARKGSPRKLRRDMANTPPGRVPTREQRSARIWDAVRSASLVLEPARFIHASRPEWVTLEQVPAVLPLWQVYAEELRKQGYGTWCGTLNAADYGVPQTRIRAILIASRIHRVSRPEPTHYDPRKGDQLWGTPWVSMAQALGWGATGRPAPTATAGGVAQGGYEPFAKGGRECLAREQEAGRWALRMGNQAHAATRPAPAPAPAIAFGHNAVSMRWVLHTNRGQDEHGDRQIRDPRSAPAPAPALTSKSGGQWQFRNNNNNNNASVRSADEPAGTLFFGQRSNWAAFTDGEQSIRITVQEAAILQSFRPDYPWRGTKTKQFEQVGNAIPPLLAEHVLAMAAGIQRQERAA